MVDEEKFRQITALRMVELATDMCLQKLKAALQISELKNQLQGKEKENQNYAKVILELESKLKQKDREGNEQTQKILNLEAKLQKIELEEKRNGQKILAFEYDIQEKMKKIAEYEKRILQLEQNTQKIEDERNGKEAKIASVSIHMDSLLSLNNPKKGWKIVQNNTKEIKDKKMITVAVLGMYDVGKSWFCNEFSNSQQYASGYSQTTRSLNFVFPTEAGNLIGLIDTPGSNEAIRVTDKELLKMIETKDYKQIPEGDKEKYFWQYKQLKNDARLLEDLKEKFISEISDLVILICNKMSDKEQEILYKVIKNYFEVMKSRTSKYRKERDTNLLIIHNYKNFDKKEQVEEQIKKDLIKSFYIEKIPLFNSNNPEFEKCNQYMYKDHFGISHLLLACKNSPAGKHYNPTTFEYIKETLSTMINRTSTDVARTFYEFCQENISNLLKQSDLKLEYDEDHGIIYKNPKSQNIVLENLHYDEFGNLSISSCEPKYSIIRRMVGVNQEEEVIVDVELLDSEFRASLDRSESGEQFLRIIGKKSVPTENNCTREWGRSTSKSLSRWENSYSRNRKYLHQECLIKEFCAMF